MDRIYLPFNYLLCPNWEGEKTCFKTKDTDLVCKDLFSKKRKAPFHSERKRCCLESIGKKNNYPPKETELLALEAFKEKLEDLCTFNQDLSSIGECLFKDSPKTIKLPKIVDLVFKHCHKHDIIIVLDAISTARPSFTLSPYDKIRRKIVEDKEHILNNSSLITLLEKHALETDKEKLADCYDLAYRVNHPYIYRLSRVPILPSDYSLNFLWINLNPQSRVTDIYPN